ncbi:MAG TPA: NADH-quinone oxidoreductase subunit C [Gemmatales bacterium]|nr:NADH-quinone oxidoreductase subunit C [Gemmatales bacterium]HMP59319.1 NADH-quinone oxidoreductase subunit C [Gemmatales bacterium]
MTGPEIIAILKEKFADRIKAEQPEALDPFVVIDPADVIEVFTFLRDDPRLQFDMLNCISGVDYLETEKAKVAKAGFEPHLEVVYHLSSFNKRHRFVVKLILPRWKNDQEGQLPEVPTLSKIYAAANWHERETYDLVGIQFVGHPAQRRILLSEDWDGHPLRKDYVFPLEYHGIRGR